MQVCVYCASSPDLAPVYFDHATRLGAELAAKDITLVYGGGAVGLMGAVADAVLAGGGRVVGIMPHFMKEVEWGHKQAELRFVDDMHQRKKAFLDGTDALVALPGGVGTLEELLEVLTLKRLGLFDKPIVLLNTEGFYDPLLQMLERCIELKFMAPIHRTMWAVVDEPEEVLPAIRSFPSWSEGALHKEAEKYRSR